VAVRLEGPAFSAGRLHNLPELKEVPVLDVLALIDDAGQTLALLAINRHAHRAVPTEFLLAGFEPASQAQWQCLTADSILAANSPVQPDKVRIEQKTLPMQSDRLSVSLPARSVSVIAIKAK